MITLSLVGGAGLSLDPVDDLRELTALPFMVNALEAGTLVAVMAGVAGWFMVLRHESFVGHTLSVMAFPGASGALLLGAPAATGFFVFCGGSALVIGGASGRPGPGGRAHGSAITGAVQAFGLGCGFLFLSLYHGLLGGYESLLFGSVLGITQGQVGLLAIVTGATLGFFAAVGRPLLFASVDAGVARAGGVPVRALSLSFLLVLGLAVAATAQITGALLVFALLVAPAATAQLISPRIGASLGLSVVLGALITWVGLALAYFFDYPAGFFITSVAFSMYLLARMVRFFLDRRTRPRRGPARVGTAA